eukprot:m.361107 g.361107  ORF g.361107 m.361107 type:complete len:219 (+) comp19332_c0_seq1:351-1007(+)
MPPRAGGTGKRSKAEADFQRWGEALRYERQQASTYKANLPTAEEKKEYENARKREQARKRPASKSHMPKKDIEQQILEENEKFEKESQRLDKERQVLEAELRQLQAEIDQLQGQAPNVAGAVAAALGGAGADREIAPFPTFGVSMGAGTGGVGVVGSAQGQVPSAPSPKAPKTSTASVVPVPQTAAPFPAVATTQQQVYHPALTGQSATVPERKHTTQ